MTNLPHQRFESPRDAPAGPFDELPEVAEFREEAGHASYHHADDSGGEWSLAKPHERRCQAIYDAAAPGLKDYLASIKGEYFIRIRTGGQ